MQRTRTSQLAEDDSHVEGPHYRLCDEPGPGDHQEAAGHTAGVAHRRQNILDLLLLAGAPIDVVVGVTLFLACWLWRRFDAAKFLVLRGANVNFQDKKGRTALHHGVEKEFDPALLTWLLAHGAASDIPDAASVSPSQRAARKRDKRFLAVLPIEQ